MLPEQTNPTDEISLRDILNTINKQKILIFIVLLLTLVLSAAFVFLRPQTFTYKQGITPASYFMGGSKNLLEPTNNLVSKTKEIYLPQFIENYNQAHPDNNISIKKLKALVSVSTNNEKDKVPDSGILYLTMDSSLKNKSIFDELRNFVLNAIINDQKNLIVAVQNEATQIIEILTNQLTELKPVNDAVQNSLMQHMGGQSKTSASDAYIAYMALQSKEEQSINLQVQIINLQQKMTSLIPASFYDDEIMLPANKISNVMIILLSLILGLVLGIFLAFIAENWRPKKL